MAAAQQTGTGTRTAQRRGAQNRRTGTTRKAAAKEEGTAQKSRRTATVPVPVVTPHVTVHRVHLPAPPRLPVSGREVADVGKAVTAYLPPRDRMVYYAGLGALAAFGVVDWPVALAIGVGVGIARRAGRARDQRPWATGEQERAKK
ncbi:hypothetical protein GCM10010191_43750 [Actinomadura vinacea]|uniref:Uncharacterized protein n=1 Tax=Actinomadura vinacea TaxID=115336 RepID=A0ABP5WFN9_9ACTN